MFALHKDVLLHFRCKVLSKLETYSHNLKNNCNTFCCHFLSPGTCTIKLFTAVIYRLTKIKLHESCSEHFIFFTTYKMGPIRWESISSLVFYNSPLYWALSKVMKKMKCCEYSKWKIIALCHTIIRAYRATL